MSSIIYIAHALILALSMLSSCYLITYQHHCLCRAFVPVYLSLVMDMGCVLLHVMSLYCWISCHGSCVVLWFLCGLSLSCVNHAFEPVGERCARSLRSQVRLAMAVTPSMDLSLVFGWPHRITMVSSYLGPLDVVIWDSMSLSTRILTHMFRALCDQLYWDRN
jgi:hypothetical protein